MLSFVPIHLSASESFDGIRKQILSWAPQETTLLDATSWFELGHDIVRGYYGPNKLWYPTIKSGIYVWEPPPAEASVAIEELHKAHHKRQNSFYI
eukprot:479422-Ditylum_brightwellii.AAC.1